MSFYDLVMIDYTNWRGIRRKRVVVPVAITFEGSVWHPERQWLLKARDVEKGDERFFAMKDIHSWEPAP